MPNSIKYSTTGDTLSLRKGNFYIGTGDVGKGPTSSSGHWNGITPPSGGYSVYKNKVSNGPAIWTAASDNQLVLLTNNIEGTSFTTAQQCLNYYATQTDKMVLNEDYEGIITNGLVLNLDAGFTPSYQGSGTTWYDLSYSGNNGTLTNGPTYSSLDGGYISFDGVDDYVLTSYSANPSYFTIEMIARPKNVNTGTSKVFLGKYKNSGNDYWIGLHATDSSIVWSANGGLCDSDVIANVNTFYTISASVGQTSQKIYVDGQFKKSASTVTTSPQGNIALGVFGENFGFDTNVDISSVRIYNRELTSSEILQNYNSGLSRFNTSNIVKNGLVLNLDSSNTVSYPTSGTTWTDLSGYGNKGTLTNGPTFDSTSKSIVFDGVDDYVDCGVGMSSTGKITVNAWVKLNNVNTFQHIVDSSSNTWHLAMLNNIPYFWNGSTYHTTGTQLNSGTWYMITGVQGTTLDVYVNGVLSNSLNSDINVTTNNVWLGRWQSPQFGVRPLNGNIELAQIYNRALSPTEILQNYYGGPIVTSGLVMALDAGNLVSYVNGTTSTNSLVGSNVGTLNNGTGFSGGNGGVWDFDGTNDWIQIPTYTFGNGNWSVSAWVNADDSSNYNIISNSSGGPVANAFGLETGKIFYRNYDGNWQNRIGNTTLSNGNWYMLTWVNYAGASDSLGTMRMYVNGVIDSSQFNSYTTNGGPCDAIGRNWFSFYNGKIGNIQFYNKSLTDSEIARNFNAYKSRFGL
jgi:hypothetical protein